MSTKISVQALIQQIEQLTPVKNKLLSKTRRSKLNDSSISTGLLVLDQVLSAEGIRRGWLSEFMGDATSGALTVALQTANTVQRKNEAVIFVDLADSFDPIYAVACGVDLERLYLITPTTTSTGLAMIYDMVMTGGIGLIILDTVLQWSQTIPTDNEIWQWLQRLTNRLHQGQTTLIVLTPSHTHQQGWLDTAVLRLQFTRQEWVHRGRDIGGWTVQVGVLKDRFNPVRLETTLYIELPELS